MGTIKNENASIDTCRVNKARLAPTESTYHLPISDRSSSTVSKYEIVHEPVAKILQYQTESARLASYTQWPMDAQIRPENLAKAGLFYTGSTDKVKCPYCLGAMYNWEDDDDPLSEHKKHYPECEFVKYVIRCSPGVSRVQDRIKAAGASLTISGRSAQNASSAVLNQNVNSGAQFSHTTNVCFEDIPAVKIVKEMGYSIGIMKLAAERIPNRKQSTFSTSALLDAIFDLEGEGCDLDDLDSTGEEPVNNTLQISQESTPSKLSAITVNRGVQFASKKSAFSHSNGAAKSPTPNLDNSSCNKPTASPVNTRTGDVTIKTESSNTSNSSNENPCKTSGNSGMPYTEQSKQDVNESQNTSIKKEASSTGKKKRVAVNGKYKKLAEEHQKLSKNKVCNVCRKQSVSILFLPCRHLICCEPCGDDVRNCPQCQELIVGTVKIYLS